MVTRRRSFFELAARTYADAVVRTSRRRRWLSLAALAAALGGCGGALTVRGEIVKPAEVPVRAFPRILVTSTDDAESREIALSVARHLAEGRSSVDRLDRGAIAMLRAAGQIERTTAVIELSTTLTQHARPAWRQNEQIDCGPAGCMDGRRTGVEDVPVLRARVVVTVQDGPSGRALQRVELREEESGADVLAMRLRVIERVAARTLALVDQRIEQVPVHLYPVDLPGVRRALAALREGRWPEGRRMLAALVESDAFEALPPSVRALVLYDLGQACRFDVSLPPEQRFREAGRALRAAVRLVPSPLYAQAIAELEQHRQSRAMVREQQEAMAHNFGLDVESAGDAPPIPPRYRR